MSKALIITEKPSVAQDIARALGGFKKGKESFESDHYLMSWAVGHLFELAVPEAAMARQALTVSAVVVALLALRAAAAAWAAPASSSSPIRPSGIRSV